MKSFALTSLALIWLLSTGVHAYTLYTGDTITEGDYNLTFTLYTKSSANFDDAITIYQATLKINDTNLIEAALNDTYDALADAKSDDVLYIKTADKTLSVPYGGCKRLDKYNICFDAITYFEEDAKPLGDGRLDTVKVVDGETMLPFTVTITEAKVEVTATRTFSPASVYPGELVKVTVSVTNNGVETATGVSVTEYPPLTVKSGKADGFAGSLAQHDQLLFTYTVTPQAPGDYVFTSQVASSNSEISLPDSTLTVKSPVALSISASDTYLDTLTVVDLSVTNSYGDDITITKIDIDGADTYVIMENGLNPTRSFGSVELAPGEVFNTSLGFTGKVAGSKIVSGYVEYTTNSTDGSAEVSTTYERREPTLVLTPMFSGSSSSVTIRNDGPDAVDGIKISWSDGYSRDVARLKPSAEATMTHDFAFTQPTEVSLTVSAPMQGARKAFSKTESGSVGPADPNAVVQTPVQEEQLPPEQPTEGQPTQAEPVVDGSEAAEAKKEGFFTRLISGFVDVLDRLFG